MSTKTAAAPTNGSTVVTGNNSSEPYVSPYMRKPKKFSLWRGIYNKDKNYILGRTPRNWGSLLIFYAIFYAVLASLFAICMQGLFATLSDTEPKWKLADSRIGSSPGLGFRPISDNYNEGSIIRYDSKDENQVEKWTDLLNKFLEPYIEKQQKNNQAACDFASPRQANRVCAVNVDNFGPCTSNEGFGYNKSSPCIFLKLNKIYDWVPVVYDDVFELPDDMPAELKLHIAKLPREERQQVWVSCRGENSADREVIGPVAYFPQPGFPSYYYPYKNSDGYMSPLIAVQFSRPELHRLVNIECRAWAKNIEYSGSYRDRQGSVHFELMID